MFTIEQVHEAFNKIKSGSDFPQFVQNLRAIGVIHYDNFVSDGRTRYYGLDNFILTSESKYPTIDINNLSSPNKLKHAISTHQQGGTDYLTFCKQASDAGVEKWTTHMIEMTVTYLDKQGNSLAVEPISQQ